MQFLSRVGTHSYFSLFLAVTLLTVFSGCANPSSSTSQPLSRTVSLSLGQFPSDKSSYHIYVDFWNGSSFLSETDLGLSNVSGLVYNNFSLPGGTTRFGIYLLDPQFLNNDPLYFDFYNVKSSDTSFGSYYWLDYVGYFNTSPQNIRFGISEQAGTAISNLSDLNMDFRKAPYFLYQYPNSGGSLLSATYSSVGDGVWASFGSSISAVITSQKYTWSGSYLQSGTLQTNSTPVYLIAEPSEFSNPTSASISFTETSRVAISDTINCLVSTDKPNLVYAVTKNSHSLYQIDPIKKSASLICQFPLQNIKELVYSSIDHKLYGYSTNSGTLLVYDIINNTSETVVYALSTIGAGIAISPTERRIYLCAGSSIYDRSLYILDQDTLGVISSGSLTYSDGDISYSLAEKAILYSGTYVIKKYSVANDVIVDSGVSYSSTQYYGDNGFVVNHKGTQLVYANIGTGYFVRTIDANTMQVNSTWNIGAYPRRSIYSFDDRYIFASIGDGKAYRALTSDFSQISSYVFPPTYFVVNSDSSRLIGFSDSDKSFYFVDLSSGTPASNQFSGTYSGLSTSTSSKSVGTVLGFSPRQKH